MKLKPTLTAVATAAFTGTVLLMAATQAHACIYSQRGITDSAPSTNPTTNPTTTQVDLGNSNGINKLGAAGLAGLAGLFAGGLFLKRRLDRTADLPVDLPVDLPIDEEQQVPELLPEPEWEPETSKFAIEVPQEVIRSLQSADASELTSVR